MSVEGDQDRSDETEEVQDGVEKRDGGERGVEKVDGDVHAQHVEEVDEVNKQLWNLQRGDALFILVVLSVLVFQVQQRLVAVLVEERLRVVGHLVVEHAREEREEREEHSGVGMRELEIIHDDVQRFLDELARPLILSVCALGVQNPHHEFLECGTEEERGMERMRRGNLVAAETAGEMAEAGEVGEAGEVRRDGLHVWQVIFHRPQLFLLPLQSSGELDSFLCLVQKLPVYFFGVALIFIGIFCSFFFINFSLVFFHG